MGRDDFFRWSFRIIKEKSVDAVQKSVDAVTLLTGQTAEADQGWHKAGLFEQLSARPKLMFFGGQPYYLGLAGEEVNAFKALCPQDKKILRWQENASCFVCMTCGSKFNRKGEAAELFDQTGMFSFKTKVAEGIVYLSFEQK